MKCLSLSDAVRSVLNSEIERLETLCQDWLHIKTSTPELSHDVIGLIDAAVGQARLLMSKKFSQFRGLIERCEKSFEHETEDPPVTCSDLDGYWDMTYIQVENIDIRFNKLKKLKENNWTEQDIVPKHKQNTGLVIRKPMKTQVKSSLREMIAAARKKKQQADILQMNDSVEKNVGIFTVRTPENVGK
ncbi:hypothetical protein ANN_04837 [Periplaneta americana]|uniref:Disks large-associated protein 5 n=1 Tax=Periplaneta americana TaxID=6978 RepID=A0ABQ8T9F9_PERAM|nr:hypothetical protein ANN_04837 [Periplaneta americana]